MSHASLLALSLLLAAATTAASLGFKCGSPATCESMVGYTPTAATTLSAIKALFEVKSERSLLAANSLPLSTPSSYQIDAGSVVRVPFPCNCTDGVGISNRRPIYTVRKDDGMDAIARKNFSGFVKYQDIAKVNNIPDADKILIGQKLWIPLPCSCDPVDDLPTVHYGHVVAPESTVEQIAEEFGTTQATLLRLNGIDDPTKLMAEQVLDVPLRACFSSISNTSSDSPLLVTNGSYALTAFNCVQCFCTSENWQLLCKPVKGLNSSKSPECPLMQCEGESNLLLGNSTVIDSCRRTVCSYAGYTNGRVLTALTNQSTCPGGSPTSPTSSPPNNSPRGSGWQSWSLRWFNLGFLCFYFIYGW